jgi:tetratricopeptide (TPR) repeat protein
LLAAIRHDPLCAEAWLGLAWLAQTPQERESLLKRVLELEPGNVKAQAKLARLKRKSTRSATGTRPASSRRRWVDWALLALALGLLGLVSLTWEPVSSSLRSTFSAVAWLLPPPTPTVVPTPTLTPQEIAAQFAPQLQAALSSANWDRAREIIAIMRSVDPHGEQVRQWSLETHLRYGQALVARAQAGQALSEFDQAVALAPDDADARLWQAMTQGYLTGRRALDAGDWPAAIQAFSDIRDENPDYADVSIRLVEAYRRQGQAALEAKDWNLAIEWMTQAHERLPEDSKFVDLLAQAHRGRGIAGEEQGNLKQARADLEAALALRPGDAEAKTHLAQVMVRLFPPKRIEIDITKQRMYVYEGKKKLWTFVISTGLPGRDTAAGHFTVLDKIPMAYSAIWRLKMPNWLGIYYVGRVENGIHALPIRPDGSVMWGGLLGTKQSYGCIILNNESARTLYNWAQLGTAVDIHY